MKIKTTDQMYDFVNRVMDDCRNNGYDDIAMHLGEAMQLGSSGTEILGAIRNVLVEEHGRLIDIAKEKELLNAIKFVDKVYGR